MKTSPDSHPTPTPQTHSHTPSHILYRPIWKMQRYLLISQVKFLRLSRPDVLQNVYLYAKNKNLMIVGICIPAGHVLALITSS